MPRIRTIRLIAICTGFLLLLGCRRHEIAHGFSGARLALPAELQGEVQGMAAHWAVVGRGGAISSANALATEAGIDVLKAGGNAIDALLAVQWVLAVVEPQSSGLGGGGFLLYYEKKSNRVFALDGREELPAQAEPNLFRDAAGQPLPFKQKIAGARAVGVPGTVALMGYAKKRFGSEKISFAATFPRAIDVARNGFRVSPRLSQAMHSNRERLTRQNGANNAYLRGGEAYAVGEAFYQTDLAGTLERLAEKGAADFYTGNIAHDIIATVQKNQDYPSAMRAADLRDYRVVQRQPAEIKVGGAALYSVAAPASGAYLLRAIADSARLGRATGYDLILHSLQGQRIAFAAREQELEDPDFSAAKKASANLVPEAQNTSHISVADAEGNIVSYTTSIETSMGSALIVRGRGFLLNNQLSDFSAEAGKVNSVEPGRRERTTALNPEARETLGGKRPKSSMSPLIIFKGDGSFAALGSPGGPTIVGSNAIAAEHILAGEDLQTAVNQPRALQMPNGKTLVELPLRRDSTFLNVLRQKGFEVETKWRVISLGSVQAVGFDARTEQFTAATDLRREGLGLVVNPVVE
jgi:gamma-glutamyltranspeptidase / glutathione hydrolase